MSGVVGRCICRSVEGSTYNDRLSFDQSVPYTVSNSGNVIFQDSVASSEKSIVSSVILPAKNNFYDTTSAAVLVGLQKQVAVEIKGIHFYGIAENVARIQVVVCDPNSAYPTADNTVMLIDEFVYGSFDVTIPDIKRFVIVGSVSQPLNVVLKISGVFGTDHGKAHVSYKFICTVDD